MGGRPPRQVVALLEFLRSVPDAKLVANGSCYVAVGGDDARRSGSFPKRFIRELVSRGLLVEAGVGSYAATAAASAWIKRQKSPDLPFRSQHDVIEATEIEVEKSRSTVLLNLSESPISLLARRKRAAGEKPWLAPHAVAAAERLRRDFEIAQLQPRVTANWSANINTGKRSANPSDVAQLTDSAIAAKLRFDRAIQAVGPELAGVLIDICCFVKGLETVERERRWPARSAKLVLRMALEGLARHYGLCAAATGTLSKRPHHWGADDYRPEIS